MTQELPASARAVIVGAGSAGASVAHNVAAQTWDGLVVVNAGPLAQWTVEVLSALDAKHPVGSIEGRDDPERWAELHRPWARRARTGSAPGCGRPHRWRS